MARRVSEEELHRRLCRLLALPEATAVPADIDWAPVLALLEEHLSGLRASLDELDERWRAVFEGASSGHLLLDGSIILECNEELCRMLRRRREDLVGRTTAQLSPASQPDGRNSKAASAEYFDQALAGSPRHFYWRYLRSDGETLDAEVHLRAMHYQGRRVVLAVATDVTARTSAEQALFQSQHMFQWVLNTIPQRVFWKDRNSRFLGCNRAFLEDAGLSDPSQLIGRTDFDMSWREMAELYRADDRWAVETGQAKLGYEEPQHRPDGSVRWLKSNKVPLFDAEGQIVGVLGTYEDITERKRTEERQRKLEAQVQQAQKLESLGVLAGGIAHDFNNLLTGILGHADLALSELSPVSPARQSLQQIELSARRAADLTRQMLAYSGHGRFLVQRVSLAEVVQEMSHLLEITIGKKCVLKYRFPADLPPVEADVTQLRQLIMNLTVNASEAIGEKSGVITLSTGVMHCDRRYLAESYLVESLPDGTYVFLEVADTGCGMDAETKARIFDPFFSTKFTGRGLGLAAVLGIVRGHRGAIKVYSEPGRGSTFKALFPAAGAPVGNGEAAAPTPPAWKGEGTVLVVDDEATVRVLAQRMLERCGFQVLAAADGREAVDAFRRNPDTIRLVLLDMTMPHMDGEETYRELRRIRPDVTVVLTSGYNEQEATTQFSGKGLAGFIQKPYRLEDLARVMRRALEGT